MEIVMDPSVAQQEFLCMGNTGTPDWHWDPGGTTYRFPVRSADYVLESTVGLAVEHVQFRSAPVANQFMGRLPRLSWHDIHTRDHGVVSTPWQELVGGGALAGHQMAPCMGPRILHLCVGHRGRSEAEQWW